MAPRRPAVQRQRNAAQAKIAAQIRSLCHYSIIIFLFVNILNFSKTIPRGFTTATILISILERWITTAREGRTAVARQTAASRGNVRPVIFSIFDIFGLGSIFERNKGKMINSSIQVLGALVVARRRRAVKQSVDAAS